MSKLFILRRFDTLQFSEHDFQWLTHNVDQYIESASVWHADDKMRRAILGSRIDSDLKTGNKTVAAFQSESFLCVEFLSQESAVMVSPVESVIKMYFLFVGHSVVLNTFEACANPIANICLWDVAELDSNLATVSLFVSCNDIF